MDCPQLSARRIGFVAVFLLVLISTQLLVGAAVAAPAVAEDTQTASDAETAHALGQFGADAPLDVGTPDLDYSSTGTELGSDLTGQGFGEGTTYPVDEPTPSDIVPTDSAVDTLSSYADNVSPPVFLTLLGYSRYDNSDPLEHDLRASLQDRIESEAGVTLAELVSDTDASESTVRYHTRILEEESLVEKVSLWGNVRLFPAAYDPQERALTAALDETALRSVLSAIGSHEPATVTTIAAEIDRAPSTVSHHLSRLETVDLIDRERDGKRVLTSLKPAARRALTTGTVETDTAIYSVGD